MSIQFANLYILMPNIGPNSEIVSVIMHVLHFTIFRHCREKPENRQSLFSDLLIIFTSDDKHNARGFDLEVTAVHKPGGCL